MALIYIIEDDPSIQEIEIIALKNSNYMVQAFDRASDFYEKLEEILPDLILLDIMLPDEDGYQIVRKLRSSSRTSRIPVIMITAKTTEMDMVKGLDDILQPGDVLLTLGAGTITRVGPAWLEGGKDA